MKQINASTTITASDTIKANRSILLNKLVVKIILILCPIFFIFGALTFTSNTVFGATFLIALPILFPWTLFVQPNFAIKKQFKNNPKLSQEITWIINQDGIALTTEDINEKWNWGEFISIRENDEFIFCYLKSPKNMAKFIPKRAFKSSAECKEAFELSLEKISS